MVGFKNNKVILMPLGELNSIGPGCDVVGTGKPLTVQVGHELLGKVLDGLGQPLDGTFLPARMTHYSTNNVPSNPLKRPRVQEPISVGVRCIDGLLTIGKGQRVGIFCRIRRREKYADGNDRKKYVSGRQCHCPYW